MNPPNRGRTLLVGLACLLLMPTASVGDELTIVSWNIENIGAEDGRGFAGGFGAGDLPPRTDAQLSDIAEFITDTLAADVIAIQEVSITHFEEGRSRCEPLDKIIVELEGDWEYFIQDVDFIPDGHANLFVAFLWNSDRVQASNIFPLMLPNPDLAGANLYDRTPLVGYFEARNDDADGALTNDFVLVNVHLKSGQDHDENHLMAITLIEHSLTRKLKQAGIKESDRIILGDFNDNPYAKRSNGKPKFSDAMYQHMAFKKYTDLVTESSHATRMNTQLTSIIDHVLVNSSAKLHIDQDQADIFLPGAPATFATWRLTFSDHFPVSFKLDIRSSDDDVD